MRLKHKGWRDPHPPVGNLKAECDFSDLVRKPTGAQALLALAGTMDAKTAEHEASLERAGKRPGRVDAQVAALARLRAERVLTRDRKFPKVAGVGVEGS